MNKFKLFVADVVKTAKNVFGNAEEFVIAVSLLVSTYYNYATLVNGQVSEFEYYVRLSAVAVTGLFSLWLLVKHFNKRGE